MVNREEWMVFMGICTSLHIYIYMPYKYSHMLMLHSPLMALAEVVTVVSSVDGS